MTDDVTVRGADAFLAVSQRMKAAGQGELRKEFTKAMKAAARPIIPKTRQAALSRLPKRGGFAAMVAKEPQRVQVRTGAGTAGVRIVVGKKGGGARAANDGTLRHPVFGTGRFVTQQVPPGWHTETAQAEAPAAREAAVEVLQEFTERLVGG